jgi:hypothetical protein
MTPDLIGETFLFSFRRDVELKVFLPEEDLFEFFSFAHGEKLLFVVVDVDTELETVDLTMLLGHTLLGVPYDTVRIVEKF